MRGKARPLEMTRDLVAHDIGLFQNLLRDRFAAKGCGLIHNHGEWSLQGMSEISDMRARTLDDLLVCFYERIGFACKGGNFLWKISGQTLGATGADCREAIGDAFQGREPKTNLKGRCEQQHRRQNGKGNDKRSNERVSSRISAAS